MVTQLYLFAFYLDNAIDCVTNSNYPCTSLGTVRIPTTVAQQSTNLPPETVGISFAADVI